MEIMKNSIQESFDHIRKALDFREKLLCRQVDVLQKSSHNIHFIPENEVNLLHLIRIFGKFNVNKFNVSSDFMSNEDYEEDDPVLMYKQLIQTTTAEKPSTPISQKDNEKVVAKELLLVDDNANKLNESLINIILKESMELIEKSDRVMKLHNTTKKQKETKEGRHGNNKSKWQIAGDTPAATVVPLVMAPKSSKNSSQTNHQHQSKRNKSNIVVAAESAKTRGGNANSNNSSTSTAADKSQSSSSSTVVALATSGSTKKKFASLKNISNLTLNSGTLNLRNITNLTINTSCSNARPTAITNATADYDVQAVTCDFYNRLINENKLLQPNCCTKASHCEATGSPSVSDGTTTTTSTSFKEFSSGMERKLMEKMDNWNAEVTYDANGNVMSAVQATTAERPKQIQHWLKQIINDSELEPMQNTELLEFSRIKSST